MSNDSYVKGAVEAVLMVVDEPVSVTDLATAIDVPTEAVLAAIESLQHEYLDRGFVLRQVDGAWRLYSSPMYADVVGRFLIEGRSARLSQAALETLAVVAYRQPVTRGQVSQIRGVNVDAVMKTLATRGLVTEVGERSGALLYGTTTEFLDRMGLSSLDDLPALAPYLPNLDDVEDFADGGSN